MHGPGKSLILFLLFLPLVTDACAHEITIASKRAVYQPGDTITISGRIWNAGEEQVNITVELLVEDLEGRVPTSPLHLAISLPPGQKINLTMMEALVDDGYYSGLYKASARIIEGRFVADEDELFFEVQGAPEDMSIRILLCEDPECREESLVFIRNERVYIGYIGTIEDILISASISHPDGSAARISLPYNFTAKVAGAYSVVLSASKAGYRDLTLVRSFAVIDGEPGMVATDREPSNLHLQVGRSRIAGDTAISLEGHVEPVHADADVIIVCEKGDGTIVNLTATTDDDGGFWQRFQPEPTFMELLYGLIGEGTKWRVKAVWDGDSNHLGSESDELDIVIEHEMPLEILVLGVGFILVLVGVGVALARRRR